MLGPPFEDNFVAEHNKNTGSSLTACYPAYILLKKDVRRYRLPTRLPGAPYENCFLNFFLVYHVPARYATEALYTPEFTRTQPIPHLLLLPRSVALPNQGRALVLGVHHRLYRPGREAGLDQL